MRNRWGRMGLWVVLCGMTAACGGMGLAVAQDNAANASGKKEKPYNFIVMMADDLGAPELGCYGNEKHRTPNLDKLAGQGMRFETCYATPICTSSRVMIMTGQYGFRSGYYNFMGRAYTPTKTSPQYDIGSKFIFADALKSAGYVTGIAGKWQLTGQLPTRVHDCGFDEYRMWAYQPDLPPGVKHTGAFEGGGRTARYWHPSIMENGKYKPTTPNDYGPNLFTDFLIDFITRHKDEPFCFYYPMCLTHDPWDPTPDLNNPGQKTPPGLKPNVEYMDHLVGRIVKAVDDLGLGDRTVILFTGDNGTLRAGKGEVSELGARVPLIVRCPGTVQAGVVSGELADLTDVLPTLVDFAQAKTPADLKLDGLSLRPTLTGGDGPRRDWCFSYLGDGRVLRDKRWLMFGHDSMRLFDCGDRRDGQGYVDKTEATDPETTAARHRMTALLEKLPGPQGHPDLNPPTPGGKKQGAGKNKGAGKKAGGKKTAPEKADPAKAEPAKTE